MTWEGWGDHRVTTGWPPGDHRVTGSIERNHSGANTPCVTTSLEAWQAWRQEQTENITPVCCPYPLLTHRLSQFKPKLHWRWLVWATAHFHAEARRAPNCDRQSIDAFSPATVGYEGRVVSVDQGLEALEGWFKSQNWAKTPGKHGLLDWFEEQISENPWVLIGNTHGFRWRLSFNQSSDP